MIENFHFIRPVWFFALIALALALYLLKRHRVHQSPWQQFLPAHLAKALLANNTDEAPDKKASSTAVFLLTPFLIGLLTITALAGPTWQQLPQPVYQVTKGSVLIMDMSYSMYATDIKPNRLTRARFKAIDLLDKLNEGDMGLVAYAGDAFIISPLTQDINNIELLLPSLTPEIMPELGSNPLAALTVAHEMLTNAGHVQGDIYWLTDGIDSEDIEDIIAWSNEFGHTLNILGVGSQSGAPITLPSGKLLKDNSGAIVVPKLHSSYLQVVAKQGHGVYQRITNNADDIDALTYLAKSSQAKNSLEQNDSNEQNSSKNEQARQNNENQSFGDQWQELGPWLLLLVLPLLLSYFRRGALLIIMPFAFMLMPSPPANANENISEQTTAVEQTNAEKTQESALNTAWRNLWQTDNQQAQQKFTQQNYQQAAKQFNDSNWQGSAHYKAGNYQQALDAFKQSDNSDALYNQGNALAKLERFDEAIDAYKKALEKNSKLADAQENIDKIEAMKKQQEQQQNKDQEQQSEQEKNKDQNQDNKDQQGEQSEQDKSSDSQQKNDPQDSSESDSQKQNEDESNDQAEQDQANKDKSEQEQRKEQQAEQQKNEKTEQQAKQQQAQLSESDEKAKETEQKHQQLLNQVTDDPYLLLRNKMQLEYQKRKQNGSQRGAKKKW